MWLLLDGEISVFKRPESMYEENGNPTNVKQITLFQNPVDSKNEKMGLFMGTIKEVSLLADDAIVFSQPMIYSLKTKTCVLAWKCPT